MYMEVEKKNREIDKINHKFPCNIDMLMFVDVFIDTH
jgi:hypothetical protein